MKPNYNGGSIANLMSSLSMRMGANPGSCTPLDLISLDQSNHKKTVLIVADGLGYLHLGRSAASLSGGTAEEVLWAVWQEMRTVWSMQ